MKNIKEWDKRFPTDLMGKPSERQIHAAKDAEIGELRLAYEQSIKRIKYLEILVDAYSLKSFQYDVEHPCDGLNAIK